MRSIKWLLLLLPVCSCSDIPEESNEERLKRFYSWYITENDSQNKEISRDSLREYCTATFLKNVVDDTDLDYDPIISGQDYDKEWVKTLTVTKATANREKEYRVSFLLDKEMNSHNLVVTMGKEDGVWKIDYVKDNK